MGRRGASRDFPQAGSQPHAFYLLLGASGSSGQAAQLAGARWVLCPLPRGEQHPCAGAGGEPCPQPMFPGWELDDGFGCP